MKEPVSSDPAYPHPRIEGDEVKLPRPPGVFRRFLAEHPVLVDWFIVASYLFGALLMLALTAVSESIAVNTMVESGQDEIDLANPDLPPALQPGDWVSVPALLTFPAVLLTALRVLVVAASLLFRRRFPLIGLIAVTVALIGDTSALTFANGVALLFMVYAVPVYRSVAAGWLGYGIALVGSLVGLILEELGIVAPVAFGTDTGTTDLSFGNLVGVMVMTALWLLAILMLGINLGNRRRYVAAIIDHAHQLARERDQRAQLAVAEERSRIAREMHDIVAHSVSVMIALSEGAAQAATAAPREAHDAMKRSAETGRTALAEMRRLLDVLGDPSEATPERVPQPGVSELSRLVETFSEAGLNATLSVEGQTSGDRGQELAIYRIVQEGLTNTLRYAGIGARAHVEVTGDAECTRVEVRDFGVVSLGPGPISGVGAGRGLQGLTERVGMFGGTIEAVPAPGGGWRLSAELPVSAAARVASPTPRPADGLADREDQP